MTNRIRTVFLVISGYLGDERKGVMCGNMTTPRTGGLPSLTQKGKEVVNRVTERIM